MNFFRKNFFILGLCLSFNFVKTEEITTVTKSNTNETSFEYSNNITWKKVTCAVIGTTLFACLFFYAMHKGTKNMTQDELSKVGKASNIFLNIIESFANIFSMVAQSSNHKISVKNK